MPAYNIGRKTQYLILLETCGGQDTEERERRIRIAKEIQVITGRRDFEPRDLFSYDLSIMLDTLTDDQHSELFQVLLNNF